MNPDDKDLQELSAQDVYEIAAKTLAPVAVQASQILLRQAFSKLMDYYNSCLEKRKQLEEVELTKQSLKNLFSELQTLKKGQLLVNKIQDVKYLTIYTQDLLKIPYSSTFKDFYAKINEIFDLHDSRIKQSLSIKNFLKMAKNFFLSGVEEYKSKGFEVKDALKNIETDISSIEKITKNNENLNDVELAQKLAQELPDYAREIIFQKELELLERRKKPSKSPKDPIKKEEKEVLFRAEL